MSTSTESTNPDTVEQVASDHQETRLRRLLVSATKADTRQTYAVLLANQGFEVSQSPLNSVATSVTDHLVDCVILVGQGSDRDIALTQLRTMRVSEHRRAKGTAALILIDQDADPTSAWTSGVDGVVTLPARLKDLVTEIELVLDRPRLERHQYRQNQIKSQSQ